MIELRARDLFWSEYSEMLYRSLYLQEYKNRMSDRDRYINWILAFVTSASVATWALWDKYPFAWMGITIIAQVIGIMHPSFSYAKKEYALNLAIPEIDRIVIEMERDWIFIDDTLDKTLAKMLQQYAMRYKDIDSRYLLSLNLKPDVKLSEKATENRDLYLGNKYFTDREEVSV